MRHQSWIIEIDYANGTGAGAILWRLGEGGDFAINGGDPSQWFYFQHYPSIVAINGSQLTMAVFDNGNNRLDASGTACGTTVPCVNRATVFNVDEAGMTAALTWQNTPGLFSSWGGSIGLVDNGCIGAETQIDWGTINKERRC